ncbi:MAG: 4-hydroxy-3-methylbut-2-enyl diphosphate reductase [Planctomycetota bacterium]|nr:4-hydroxy-3-methylbut-2-enyl diphosphate reductase [Planctomycetota bacterium]
MSSFDATEVRLTWRSTLVERLREAGSLQFGQVEIVLPRSFGFCWGVDRALAMVEEARREHAGRPLWLISSIIHNPRVNEDLRAKGVRFLRGEHADAGAWERLGALDVVIVPAFSAPVEDLMRLEARGVTVVDTTCPWVIKPHKRTLKYVKEGFTTVIHGTLGHEETEATCSLIAHEGGHFVVVDSLEQALPLARFLEGELDADGLRAALPERACSIGFDPSRDLARVGVINQTTMLARESRAIGDRLRAALAKRDGEAGLEESFRDFDTICRATQDNQDAARAIAEQSPDLFLVVGGYDSSNTKNLARVGDDAGVPAYHIEGPHCLDVESVRHRDRVSGRIGETQGWLPSRRPLRVAFTAGASTPDALLGEVIARLLQLCGEIEN